MRVSIAIPYHDMPGTPYYLSRLMASIEQQTFTDYEIVLTNEPGMAHNHNAAILKSKGDIIKVMQMDDYFSHTDALKEIVDNFKEEWLISGTLHTDGSQHTPRWNDEIWSGKNTLGSISTLTIRNETKLLFEEPLTWVVDCDLYWRYYLKYGLPVILQTPQIVVDTRNDRLTSTLSNQLKANEVEYMYKKYGK